MKYANYVFNAKGVNNLGDQMQIIAIDYIYEKMGISPNEIIYINIQDLSIYMGEYVILPVTMPLVDFRENGIAGRFSDHIIPVFLGLTMVRDTLYPEEILYLRKYEPIGCRDERTLNTLRKYGVNSYLHGCITVTLPNRGECNGDKVYIVDLDDKFKGLIPEYVMNASVKATHFTEIGHGNPKDMAIRQYNEYKQNAKLVITSLLHCSVPCIAAGIPVILIKDKISYRMSWLEAITKIYSNDSINTINWNPKPYDIEVHKHRVLNITIDRLKNAYNKYSDILDLSFFYENREKNDYINDACYTIKCFIDNMWTNYQGVYKYSVWGGTQVAEWIVDYVSSKYPNAIFCHVYDSYRIITLKGMVSIHPDNIKDNLDEYLFITTNGAEKAALELLPQLGMDMNKCAFLKIIK